MSTPSVTLAPSAPIALEVVSDGPGLVVVGGVPMLSAASPAPGLAMTTGGSAGTVTSVNGRTGAVLVLGPLVATLTDTPTLTPDLAADGHFRVTITANRQLANPANALIDGQRWVLEVTQGGLGGFGLSYGTAYDFGASIGVPVLSSAPGKRDYLAFIYNLPAGKHDCVGFVSGY